MKSKALEIMQKIYLLRFEIMEELDEESVAVYAFLQHEFQKGRVAENPLFQFVYRSFYRLDNAGLTPEFGREYFTIMEELRNADHFDFASIVDRLYEFPRRKGDRSVQFSFTTKLVNTIVPTYPIWDSEVAKVFGFPSPYYLPNKEKKMKRYLEQYQILQETYEEWLSDARFLEMVVLFDAKFPNNTLHPIKKLDFMVWMAGKIIEKAKIRPVEKAESTPV